MTDACRTLIRVVESSRVAEWYHCALHCTALQGPRQSLTQHTNLQTRLTKQTMQTERGRHRRNKQKDQAGWRGGSWGRFGSDEFLSDSTQVLSFQQLLTPDLLGGDYSCFCHHSIFVFCSLFCLSLCVELLSIVFVSSSVSRSRHPSGGFEKGVRFSVWH